MNQSNLPKTMKAVVTYGPHDYRLEELPVPHAGPGEVVLRVDHAGVCASDMKCFYGAYHFWGDENRTGYCQPPITPGHEFAGEVVQLGEGSAEKYGLALGDMVVSEQIIPCGECGYCTTGKYWMCLRHDIYGFRQSAPGAWAEYVKLPAGARNYKLPEGMPRTHAAVVEPLACSIHAVQRGEIGLGDVVVVAGAGTLGLGMVAAARLCGPSIVISVDPRDYRLEVAKKMGADLVMNPNREDVVAAVRDLTGGYGCDVYIDATGYPESVLPGLLMLRKLGTFVEYGVFLEPATIDWTIIGDMKELNIHGAHLAPYTFPLAIDYIHRGIIDVSPIVTHELPLEQYERALEMVHEAKESIKVLLKP
ncbi:MAG: alcohol dehydrogenase catalytic domain-containing protein [Armatimonadota bacterium]